MSGLRRAVPLVGWVLLLATVLAGMTAAGSGALAGPDLGDPASWGDWAQARTSPEAAVAVLRLVAIALCWYLLAVTLLAAVTSLGRAGRLVSAVDVVTLPFVRRVVQAGLGVGVAGAAVAAVGAGTAPEPPVRPTAADVALLVTAPGGGPSMVRVDDVAPADDDALDLDDAPPVMQRLAEVEEAPAGDDQTWTVTAGDHLWSIAEETLARAWRRPVSDAEVTPFWQQVVELNRDRLADPANPDLVFPGQVLAVPRPPSAPGP
jgi:nucleoid-associated protein YgaU